MSQREGHGRAALAQRLVALCERDTTSGAEDQGLDALIAEGEAAGATVHLDAVEAGRTNVLFSFGRPRVLFTTHLDTVPPWFAPSIEGGRVFGRGACDAKGQVLAQIEAVRRLVDEGRDGVAFLGVVGEETDSVGAAAAGRFGDVLGDVALVVDGEPTGLLAATGQRGYLVAELVARGLAAHSGSPELGRSAIWELVDALARLRSGARGVSDPELGPEVWNVGRIEGGRAANVIPDEARATLSCRTVPGSRFVERLRAACGEHVEFAIAMEEAPERYGRVPGLDYAPMPFGSDLPMLRRHWPRADAVLVGPGSIRVAHTAEEHIDVDEIERAAELLVRLARPYLGGAS